MYVSGFGSFEGINLGKFTRWVSKTASAISSGDKAALAATVAEAVPVGAKRVPAAPVAPPKPPGLFAPGGFIEKNQTLLLVAAAGLGAFLIFGRKGRR